PVSHYCVRCLFTTHTPPTPPLLPYTTLFRSPRLANFDDFEPLAAEPGVRLRFVTTAAALRAADLVVLPGSKSTMADLAWLHATRSEEHTSELQSRRDLVCRLLLEKKKNNDTQ